MGSPSDDGKTVPVRDPVETNSISVSSDEDVIPKGALDPVYEAKAKVLNHAVSILLAIILQPPWQDSFAFMKLEALYW